MLEPDFDQHGISIGDWDQPARPGPLQRSLPRDQQQPPGKQLSETAWEQPGEFQFAGQPGHVRWYGKNTDRRAQNKPQLDTMRSGPHAQPQLDKMRRGPHAHKVINRRVTSIAELGDITQLLDTIYGLLPLMNGINLATAFHRLAKLAVVSEPQMWSNHQVLKQSPIFDCLLRTVVRHITYHSLSGTGPDPTPEREDDYVKMAEDWEMPVTSMSIVSWSCATLRLRHEPLFAKIQWIVSPRIDQLKSYEFSNVLWAFSKMCLSTDALFEAASQRLLSRPIGGMTPQCLATVVWSYTTSKRRDAAVFASVASEIGRLAEDMKTQEISNTLWAFAKSRCLDDDLFDTLSVVAKNKIAQFNAQELANTVWSFATVGLRREDLFSAVEDVALRKRANMSPQNISNILLSYAKLKVHVQTDMAVKLLETAETKLMNHKRLELSTTIWAATQICPDNASFFGAATAVCYGRLQEFTAVTLLNLLQDLSVVTTTKPQYMSMLLDECCQRSTLGQCEASQLGLVFKAGFAALLNPAYGTVNESIIESLERLCEQLVTQVAMLKVSQAQTLDNSIKSMLKRCEQKCLKPPQVETLLQALDGCFHRSELSSEMGLAWPGQGQSTLPVSIPEGGVATGAASACSSPSVPALPQEPSGLGAPAGLMVHDSIRAPAGLTMNDSIRAPMADSVKFDILTLDVLCLLRAGPDGIMQQLDPTQVELEKTIGAEGAPVVLRHGILDERVVLQRCSASLRVQPRQKSHPQVLLPLARIVHWGDSMGGDLHALAYEHCRYGNVFEWMSARGACGRPVTEPEIARFALSLLQGADGLLQDDPIRCISALKPNDIFVDEHESPILRKPILGQESETEWSTGLVWLSPHEAHGNLEEGSDMWPCIAYRIGMVLYSMGGDGGRPLIPFAGHSSTTVIQWLHQSQGRTSFFDMHAHQGSEALRNLISECLRCDRWTSPTRYELELQLGTLAHAGDQGSLNASECLGGSDSFYAYQQW
jgi:hypothetical protein